MRHKRENTDSFKAGMLSIGVHAVLLIALLISFNWKTTHPINIAEVELWDSLPNTIVQKPLPTPEPVVVKEEPKPLPKVEEKPKEEVKQEPKVDIALEKKKKALELKKEDDKIKKEEAIKKFAQAAREDDLRNSDKLKKEEKKQKDDAIKKFAEQTLAEDKNTGNQEALSAKASANVGVVDEYKNKISTKIRGKVNKSLCGDGNPELKFDIGLLPTGEILGAPKLTKSSGSSACDDAVERAIIASQPLPLPSDKSLFSQFRNLNLKFRPNE